MQDIHEEARRIADQEKARSAERKDNPADTADTATGSAAIPNPTNQAAPTII